MIRIGEVILQKRMKRNLTQQQLADFLNVTMQHPLLQKYHEDIWFLQLQQKLQTIEGKIDD